MAEFAHNNRQHSARKQSPFYLMMGYNPTSIPFVAERTNVPSVDKRLAELRDARSEALAMHELARQTVLQRNWKNFVPFTVGQKVWLEAKNLRLPYETKKLAPKREGPFVIKKVLGPLMYELKLPEQWKIHPVFHASLLTPYGENSIHGPNFLEPPPDLIGGEEEYEVEALVGHRRRGRGMQYLVKWVSYSTASNEWISETNLENLPDILKAYKERNQL